MTTPSYMLRPITRPFTVSRSSSVMDSYTKPSLPASSDRGLASPMNSGLIDAPLSPGNSTLGAARVAWVRVTQDVNRNSERLSQMFTDEGLSVQVLEMNDNLYDHLPHFDLIMLESFGQVDASTISAVSSIRMGSRAPLVVLMSSYARNEMIDALYAGVDAVWALGMPREMLLARCRALLRRWLPS